MFEKNRIITEIDTYIKRFRKPYSDWYVGITADPQKRLFQEHNVDEKNGAWIYETAKTDTVAREIEEFFLDIGANGGPGGGDENTCSIYAYLITNTTKQ